MIKSGIGFLNLPEWRERLQKILSDSGHEDYFRLPVLGSENVDNPWVALDPDDFFAAVQTGIHFPGCLLQKRFPGVIVTADSALAINRLLAGKYAQTFFSAAIGSTAVFNRLIKPPVHCVPPEKILVQNDSVCGYVLSAMERQDKTLQEAVHEAQWENIASGNPNLNLHGIVTRDRLVLQIAELFGVLGRPEMIYTSGISTLAEEDVRIARELGFSIRLIGVAEYCNSRLKALVEPCIIPAGYLLAQARGGAEIFYLKTSDSMSHVYTCPGTSPDTQVRAILNDIHDVSSRAFADLATLERIEEFNDNFYVRFSMLNMTDTLSQILQHFGRAGIEIETIYQPVQSVSRETEECGRNCLVLITGKTTRLDIEPVLTQLKEQVRLASVKTCFRFIRKA